MKRCEETLTRSVVSTVPVILQCNNNQSHLNFRRANHCRTLEFVDLSASQR